MKFGVEFDGSMSSPYIMSDVISSDSEEDVTRRHVISYRGTLRPSSVQIRKHGVILALNCFIYEADSKTARMSISYSKSRNEL